MQRRRNRIPFAGVALGVVLFAGGLAAPSRAQDRPNMVFVLVDDMRYDAMSLFGHPFLETPHLDALAQNGLIFENAFVTTSLCSPSRASILTGQYAHRHQVLDNQTRLNPDTPTFPQLLDRAGYDTAFVGKWHMGGSSDEPRPGFDHWVSFPGQGVYFNPTFNIDGERVEREGYITDLITGYAETFLERSRSSPFFLYVSHKAVHFEFAPAPRHQGRYAEAAYPHPASMADTEENYATKPEWVREQRNSWHGVDGMYDGRVDFDQFVIDYAETMLAVDESVGRIAAKLRDLGLLESTLFVFTSDNGFLFGEHGLIDKRTMYEPSIRVPLLVHWPERIPRGQRRAQMILNLDFCPTFLEAAGIDPPRTVQGRSFYGLLTDPDAAWREEFLYEYFWERNFPQTPTVLGVRTDRYKFMQFHGVWDIYELYDLQEDPGERTNLIAEVRVNTEPLSVDFWLERMRDRERRELVKDLLARLERLLRQSGARLEPTWTASSAP